MARLIFITGTDTGAGKTVLTGLLLSHALQSGIKARALKPISTGDRGDAELLFELQDGKVPLDQVNPLHFQTAVTPLLAARLEGASISMSHLMALIMSHDAECELLLVEGAGGLLSPLAEGVTFGDLIQAMGPEVILAAQNKLGVLNQVLLTLEALRARSVKKVGVGLLDHGGVDFTRDSNEELLRELIKPGVVRIPEIADRSAEGLRAAAGELKSKLGLLAG